MANLPDTPITRKEQYLAAIAGQAVPYPETPLTREEAYLDAIAKNGGGGGGGTTDMSLSDLGISNVTIRDHGIIL